MRDLHASQIKAAVEAVKARKEVNEVYFVACGGSQAVLMAGQYMFDKESSIPSHVYTANEFVPASGILHGRSICGLEVAAGLRKAGAGGTGIWTAGGGVPWAAG